MNDDAAEDEKRPWFPPPPGRLIGHGHCAGDFLEAYDWRVLEHTPGFYKIEAHLPEHVKNVRKHLFGGFTPAYIDLVAARTAHSVLDRAARAMMTVNMRVDYFDPVTEPRFILEGRLVHTRGSVHLVEVSFKDLQGKLLVFSIVTLRRVA